MAVPVDQLVTAKFVLDSTGFNNSIKGINAELRNARSELQNASTQLGVFGKDSEKLKSVQEALARQVELHSKKVDLYRQSMEQTTQKMNDNIKERDKLKESLDKANKSYDEAVKLYGKESEQAKKAKEEVDKLTTEYNKKEKAIETNAKQIQNYETNMNKANVQMTKAQGELNKINDELAKSENGWLKASESLKEHSEKLKTIGKGMEDVGKGILKLTSPLVGVGVASLKVSTDFEAGMSNVKALSQATGDDFEKLKDKAKEMGAATSMSATDAANGLSNLALAGWDTAQMVEGIEPVLRLAEAGSIDLGRASALVTDSMSAMGIEVQDLMGYLDIVAQTARSSNTDIDQMAEAYIKVGGTLRGLNIPLEESALALGMMANAGIKGSEAGTGLNAVLLNLTAPVGRAAEALEILGLSAFDSQGNFKGLEKVLFEVKDKTKDLDTEQQNMYLSMIGGKEHIKTLNALMNGLDDTYEGLIGSISNADGALMEMATTMQDNTKGDIVKLKSQLEGVGIQIGEILIPYVRDFVGHISNLVDKFAQLDPKTQETIVKMSGLAVGMGGVLLVGGKLVTGVGTLVGGLSTAVGWLGTATTATAGVGAAAATAGGVGGLGALVGGLGGVVTAAAPFLAAGAAVAGVGYAVYKGMSQEAVPAVDLFADKVEYATTSMEENHGRMNTAIEATTITISEATKQAVGAYLELDTEAKKSLESLYINSVEITEDTKADLERLYSEMSKNINDGLAKKRAEDISNLEKFFSDNKSITRTEQEEIIKTTMDHHKKLQNENSKNEKAIKDILDKASKEKRALTDDERKEINKIQDEMKKTAIKTLSDQEVEAKVILERMKANDARITAEQASEHIKTVNKSRDDAIKAAEEEYDGRVAAIIRLRDEAKTISAEQADKLIKDAEETRDKSIEAAEETRDKVVEKMFDMHTDLEDQVDKTTGKILTWWDSLKNWWDSWWPESKTIEIHEVTYQSTEVISSDGNQTISKNWRGTGSFGGGLTTLHERGYELYDLPRGTRIYNHEASENMVLRTAEEVAKRIVSQNNGGKDVNVTQHIYVPTPSPSEVARQTKKQLQTIAFGL